MTKLATICYIDNGKELLLLHRNKKPNDVHEGKWISVGGKLEAGETPDECARREILEETHFTVTEMDFKGMITFPEFTPGHDWYTYVFKVTGFEGELISDEESREGTLEWVGLLSAAVVGLIRRNSVASGIGCRMRRKHLIRPRFCYYHQISIWAPKVWWRSVTW